VEDHEKLVYWHRVYRVQLGSQQSRSYSVERAVQQGSVLSPALFLMVMDLLLHQLE